MFWPRCAKNISSAVFSDFAAPLQDLFATAGTELLNDTGQNFWIFWLRILYFGLV